MHEDHKEFIDLGIRTFAKKYGMPSRIVAGLNSDEHLNSQKGHYRPFFAYDWRMHDLEDFLNTKNIDFKIIKSSEALDHLDADCTVAQVRSGNIKTGGRLLSNGIEVMYTDSVNRFHTSDIEARLIEVQQKSNCNLRKVGALLVRDGRVLEEGYSGAGDCNSCAKYKAHALTGHSSRVLCDYPHAETVCLENAEKGDDLIITCSPCDSCADLILKKEIKRVVYLEEYYNKNPLTRLKSAGVLIRKAGLDSE